MAASSLTVAVKTPLVLSFTELNCATVNLSPLLASVTAILSFPSNIDSFPNAIQFAPLNSAEATTGLAVRPATVFSLVREVTFVSVIVRSISSVALVLTVYAEVSVTLASVAVTVAEIFPLVLSLRALSAFRWASSAAVPK